MARGIFVVVALAFALSSSSHAKPQTQDLVGLLSGMMCSECAGCPESERIAVGWVAINRATKPSWWGSSIEGVILKKGQFASPYVERCKWDPPKRKDGVSWSKGAVVKHRALMAKIHAEAESILMQDSYDYSWGSTYFHAKRLGRLWPHLLEVDMPERWHHRFFREEVE